MSITKSETAQHNTHTAPLSVISEARAARTQLADLPHADINEMIPEDLCCPITQQLMFDPVSTSDGEVYEREAISKWLQTHNTSPHTNAVLADKTLRPARFAQRAVSAFISKHAAVKLSDKWYQPHTLAQEARTACQHNQAEALQRLIERDVRLLMQPIASINKRVLLHEVCATSQLALVQTVVAWLEQFDPGLAAKQLGLADEDGATPVSLALASNADPRVCAYLGQLMPDKRAHELKQGLVSGELADVQRCVRLGCSVDWQDADTRDSAVHIATAHRHIAIVRWLIAQGARVNVQNALGNNPLHQAILVGEADIVSFLVLSGGDYKQRNAEGVKPRRLASGELLRALESAIEAKKVRRIQETVVNSPLVLSLKKEISSHRSTISSLRSTISSLNSRLADYEQRARDKASAKALRLRKAQEEQERERARIAALTAHGHVMEAYQKLGDQIDPAQITQLLTYVMRGDLEHVRQCLQQTPNLVYCPGDITDLSERNFPNITGFQYACWALDKEMWELFLACMPQEAAAHQLKALEEERPDITEHHGAHFSFELILERYEHYISHYDGWSGKECEAYWCQQIGGAQGLYPAWLIMMMCEEGEDVAWVNKDLLQPVKRHGNHLAWWSTYQYNGGHLGDALAAARVRGLLCARIKSGQGVGCGGQWFFHVAVLEHDKIVSTMLSTTRSAELVALHNQLYGAHASLSSKQK